MEQPIKITRSHAIKILEWCVKTYGKSKFNKTFPTLEFKKSDYYTEGCMAFYDEIESTIFVAKDLHTDLEELVNSIIHEYVHYKQNMRHYQILALYLPDHKNPLEIEAERTAKKDTKKCLKELFSLESLK
jgi:hypothetical protein